MPKNSKVHKLYSKLKKKGKSIESAVRIAQAVTGQALMTGRKPKRKK